MAEPRFDFPEELVERAARVLDRSYDRHEATLEQIAREVLEAAFEAVPVTNYGIGLTLQFFDMVICVKDRELDSAAGVYVSGDEPTSFDALGHTIDLSWRQEPVPHLSRVTVADLELPPRLRNGGRADA